MLVDKPEIIQALEELRARQGLSKNVKLGGHGGPRSGAGRPQSGRPHLVLIAAKVTGEQRDWLKSQPEGISGAVRRLIVAERGRA